jgi:hypothetical protein
VGINGPTASSFQSVTVSSHTSSNTVANNANSMSPESMRSYLFTPCLRVRSISPVSGPQSGGTSVVITGSGFTGATSVTFGGAAASSFTVDSATQITASTAAAGAAGAAAVVVVTPGGTSNNNVQFTFVGAPDVTVATPSIGPESGGTLVNLTGTNLVGVTQGFFLF